jgi:hypothetical protein
MGSKGWLDSVAETCGSTAPEVSGFLPTSVQLIQLGQQWTKSIQISIGNIFLGAMYFFVFVPWTRPWVPVGFRMPDCCSPAENSSQAYGNPRTLRVRSYYSVTVSYTRWLSVGRGGATDLELWGTFYKLASEASQHIFFVPPLFKMCGVGLQSKSVGYNGDKKIILYKKEDSYADSVIGLRVIRSNYNF